MIHIERSRAAAPVARPAGIGVPVALYLPNKAQVRPGALDAFALPSLVSGKAVQAVRPVSLSSKVSPFAGLERDA